MIGAALFEQGRPRLGFVRDRHHWPVWRWPSRLLRSRPPCAACTSISTAPCSARAARCCAGPTARFALDGVRALQACWRADVEVVLYSGRRQSSVFEDTRLIGSGSYIFELGCGLVLDGELEWLTDGVVPSAERRDDLRPDRALGRAGAAARAVRRAGSSTTRRGRSGARSRTCSGVRSISTRLRAVLEAAGLGWLRLVDNGVVHAASEQMDGLPVVHAYHLIPAGASKARAVARHMQARGYTREDCIAVGDSREDMDAASVVGAVLAGRQRARARSRPGRRARRPPRSPDRLRALRRRGLRGGRDYAGDGALSRSARRSRSVALGGVDGRLAGVDRPARPGPRSPIRSTSSASPTAQPRRSTSCVAKWSLSKSADVHPLAEHHGPFPTAP